MHRAVSLLLLAAALVLGGPRPGLAQDTPPSLEESRLALERLARQYRDWETALGRTMERFEPSTIAERRERAKIFKSVLDLAENERVKPRFNRLVGTLKMSGNGKLDPLRDAGRQADELTKTLKKLTEVLAPGADKELAGAPSWLL